MQGWSLAEAAEAAGVSERTCPKWVARYRARGRGGPLDRSSAPACDPAPHARRTRVKAIAALRRLRMTAAEIAEVLSMPLSTVSAVLGRIGLGKRSRLEPPEPPNRYERRRPASSCTSTSRSSARISRGGHRSPGSAPAAARAAATGAGPASRDGSTCMSASTTPAAWPTSRCSTTRSAMTATGFLGRAVSGLRRARHQRRARDERQRRLLSLEHPQPSPAAPSGCATSEPGPTGRAPTEKPSASSRPTRRLGLRTDLRAPAPNATPR